MVSYITDTLVKLTAADSPTGFSDRAATLVYDELAGMGYTPSYTKKGGVLCKVSDGDTEDGLFLTAHIDTLGGMVACIKENGRLKLTGLGGLSPQNAEAENCLVYTRNGKTVEGTFQLINASVHVNKDYRTAERSFDTMEVVLDEDVSSAEDAAALGIETGCIVCFEPRTRITKSGYIKSRFLDDKLSAAILLAFAKQVKESGKLPPREVWLHFTVFEEVGHGGCASVPENVSEMLCVDMGCVGEGLSCTEHEVSICVKDSAGPYHYGMTNTLIKLAKEQNIRYAADVYPFYGSDADAALSAGHDLRHALIGAGVYASHGYERSHKDGAENTFRLICAYAYR